MRNIEIKQIINGDFAVIMKDSRNCYKVYLKEERQYLNLDHIELFKIGKTYFETEVSIERNQSYCEAKEEYIYEDNLPVESENFKSSNGYSWNLTIPEGTPQIIIYSSKYEYKLSFLNQEEYEKIYKILTENTI